MPWHVGKRTKKGYPIVKTNTGEIVGYSKTRAMAIRAVRARYANSSDTSTKPRRKK